MQRPTILLDMDGVLADFDQQYWDIAVELSDDGQPFDIEHHDQATSRFLDDHLEDKSIGLKLREMIESEGWFAGLPIMPGADNFVGQLMEYDVNVLIATKPLAASDSCRDEKAIWADENLPTRTDGRRWRDALIIAPDKRYVLGDVLLDDAIKSEWVADALWSPVVFPTAPWNDVGSKYGEDWDRFSWLDGDDPTKLVALAQISFDARQ